MIPSLFLKTTVCGERNQTSKIAALVNPHFEMRAVWGWPLLFAQSPIFRVTRFIRRENWACCAGRRNVEDRREKHSLLRGTLLKRCFSRRQPEAAWGQSGTSHRRSDGLEFSILCIVPDLSQEKLGKWHKEKWQGQVEWGFSLEIKIGLEKQAHRLQVSVVLSQRQDKQKF